MRLTHRIVVLEPADVVGVLTLGVTTWLVSRSGCTVGSVMKVDSIFDGGTPGVRGAVTVLPGPEISGIVSVTVVGIVSSGPVHPVQIFSTTVIGIAGGVAVTAPDSAPHSPAAVVTVAVFKVYPVSQISV